MQMLMEHNIDALVLAPVVRSPAGDYPNLPLLRLFQGRQIPIMCLVDSIKELDTGRITTAVYAGTRLLADHLISLGHRRIAYFSQPFQRILKYGRHAACQDAMRAADIPHHPALLVETGLTPQDAFRETNSLLERGVSFTAAMYPNDYMAIGGLRALRLSGLRVPEDVSVTGFDDVDWARFCEVPLTTVAFAARQLGEMAIREIVEHLSSEEGTAKRPLCDIDIRPQLVVRDSTGPAPH
jgi:DNA-binding LacI/PurR family transcriptional regulator